MIINNDFLNKLSNEAKKSPRLRKNHDLRTSSDDFSQRMLNALEPGTVIPIHRHNKTSETIICVRGSIRVIFYNENGDIIISMIIKANSENLAIQIPLGQFHGVECLEIGTIIFEAKDGAYEELSPFDILI